MKDLTTQEANAVSGAGLAGFVVGIITALATGAYDIGKTLAANDNDNGVTCKGTPISVE